MKRLPNSATGRGKVRKADLVCDEAQRLAHLKVPLKKIRDALSLSKECPSKTALIENVKLFSETQTPYGKVTTCIDVPLETGGTHAMYCNDPFALLSAACAARPGFGDFLARYLPTDSGSKATLAIYADETTPGNELRPDNGRKYYAVTWTFAELPQWFTTRNHGWFKFTYLPAETLENIRGGLPSVIKALIYKFFSRDSFNFETTGVRVKTFASQQHFQASFGFFSVDERACKYLSDVMGASGLHACCCCKNVCGAGFMPPAGHYFCHFSEHRRARWDPHDPASFVDLKETLDDGYNNGANMGVLQTTVGLNRNVNGLLWDPYIANIVKLPHSIFWDAMHCEYASGGNVQYLLNEFALELIDHGITLLDLDAFTQTCKQHSLNSRFWQTRVVHTRGRHIRAFAAESLDALHVLDLYCDAVVTPAGVMQEHASAVRLARDISHILNDARNIMLNVDRLDGLQEQYQEIHQRLCGSKPKNHLTRHIVDCIYRFQRLFTCWAPERDHKASKMVAANCKSNARQLELNVLDRMNHSFYFDLLHDDTLLQEVHLITPKDLGAEMQAIFGRGVVVRGSRSMNTHIGQLRAHNYVHVMGDQFLEIECFIEAQAVGRRDFYCVGFPHKKLRPQCWEQIVPQHARYVALDRVIRKDMVRVDAETGSVHSSL